MIVQPTKPALTAHALTKILHAQLALSAELTDMLVYHFAWEIVFIKITNHIHVITKEQLIHIVLQAP